MARSPPSPRATSPGQQPAPLVTIHINPTAAATHTVSIRTTITQHPTTSTTDMAVIKQHELSSDPPGYDEYQQQQLPTPSYQRPKLKLLRKCNIRSEASGAFLDCHGGGGHEPAVIAFDNETYQDNPNQIWEVLLLPDTNVVVIKSCANGCLISARGHDRQLRCELTDERDEEAQWLLEGVAWHKIKDTSVARFRNVKYENCVIDEAGGRGHGAEFISFDAHGGRNQAFQLWGR